jgi:hypothetical protein
LEASGFSCAIAEKSRVNDDVEMLGVLPLPEPPEAELLAEGELLPPPLLLHAARATPAVTASADVQLILVNKFKRSPRVFSGPQKEDARPCVLPCQNYRGLSF